MELAEPQKILHKQNADGSWTGPTRKTPVYPENHAQLVATFKEFRALIEKYKFTESLLLLEKLPSTYLHFRPTKAISAGLS